MSGDPALEPLSAASPVLIAGGGVTGRAVLAALRALGSTATLCDKPTLVTSPPLPKSLKNQPLNQRSPTLIPARDVATQLHHLR